jgi:heparan-alpha-glucosaminide N-acetyltransferase
MSWTEWTVSTFRNLNLKDLKVDQAFFNVSNALNTPFYLYTLSDDCVKCPLRKLKKIEPNQETIIKLDVTRSLEMRLYDKDLGKFVVGNDTKVLTRWSAIPELGEFGVYDLKIMPSNAIKFETAKEHVNIYSCMLITQSS